MCRVASGDIPGSAKYFEKYQTVLSQYVGKLPKEDLAKYQQMAKEWTERSPPVEVQQKYEIFFKLLRMFSFFHRMAEKHSQQYVKEFAEQMWRQLRMRVFVLTAHVDTSGCIDISE